MCRKGIFIILVIFIAVSACSGSAVDNTPIKNITSNGRFVQAVSIEQIDSIVSSSKYSIIYCWGTWCKPCISALQNEITQYLDTKDDDSTAFIPICIGGNADKALEVLSTIDFQYGSYLFCSTSTAFDKYILNSKFKDLFNNYEKVDYVPLVLLVDSKKDILNYDIQTKSYYPLLETLGRLKELSENLQ
ncbi:MAG: hypothetical protein LBO06_06630 [Bacteroidales bacterium]|jgi:thiol-disulfide isomerase/thioredoxin|nr:hypothetical protein [Bacteroidales bacterium]